MAFNHGKLLALFAFTYKLVQCLLANLRKKCVPIHSFIGGIVGSFMLLYFKTDMSINRQVGYYLAARVLEGIFLKLMKSGCLPNLEGFHAVYTLVWGLVMFLFELDAGILNKSLASSMNFLYKNSDRPFRSVKELIPIGLPLFIAKKL